MSEEKTPRQSGMEQKHEEWVLDLVNILNMEGIPVHSGGYNTNSSAGMNLPKGPPLDLGERLQMYTRKVNDERRRDRKAAYERDRAKEDRETERRKFKLSSDILEQLWDTFNRTDDVIDVGPSMRILEAFLRQYRPHVFEGEYADARRT